MVFLFMSRLHFSSVSSIAKRLIIIVVSSIVGVLLVALMVRILQKMIRRTKSKQGNLRGKVQGPDRAATHFSVAIEQGRELQTVSYLNTAYGDPKPLMVTEQDEERGEIRRPSTGHMESFNLWEKTTNQTMKSKAMMDIWWEGRCDE